MSTIARWRAEHRARVAARDAELDRQDREAAERLANLEPPPLFSEAAVNGACPKCHGTQFRRPSAGAAWVLGGVIGGAMASAASSGYVECVTCGMLFRKG